MNNRDLLQQELRAGWLGFSRRYEPLDFLGAALGSFFIYSGVTGRTPRWLTIALGATMVYIHTRRFFYAPKDMGGALRLMADVGASPDELRRLANALESQ